MNKFIMIVLFALGCAGETQYGECVGFGKDRVKGLKYEVSTRNAVWTVVGFETAVAPVVWALEYAYCPIGKAQ